MKIDESLTFVAKSKHIKVLKNYLDDPDADGSLKIQILQWMYDRLQDINSKDPQSRYKNYNRDVYTFLKLIGTK